MSYATPTRRASYTPSATPAEVTSPVSSPSFNRRVSTASSSAGYTASPAAADRKKRSRLRDYYGLGKGSPAKAGQALDIDVPGAFDADAYFHSLASTASLPDLLRRENELLNEIRELDGERQSLVYNHHHELIDASDTIRKLKSRAEALDHSLESLKTSFESISQLSTSLASVTAATRAGNAPQAPSPGATSPEAKRPGHDGDSDEVLRTPRPHRRQSSRSDAAATSPTKSDSARQRSTSSATLSPSSAPPRVPTVPFSPLLHLAALLALPIILRSLLASAPPSAASAGAESRARADSLWGTWEPALRSWEDAGVPGVREIGMECREVLRSYAGSRSSMSVPGQSPT
ncbi:hypothetical protein JCM3774_000731 [Rhodotorula dairenensis]